ncbi:RNA polymerase sigma factor [Sphingomonas oligophenolica]
MARPRQIHRIAQPESAPTKSLRNAGSFEIYQPKSSDLNCVFWHLARINPQRNTLPRMLTLLPEREDELSQHYRRWRPALLSFFLKRVHDHAEAEDLTQETFARIFGAAGTETGLHSGYIFQVAANLLRDRARRSKVRTDYREMIGALQGQGIDWLDPEKIAADRDALSLLVAGLAELPERTRTIFVLYRIENIDKRFIAESFAISRSAVEKHVARAMMHLMARARKNGL